MFFVYILESESSGIFYKGFTEDYVQREMEHNSGFARFTKGKGPWKLVYVEQHLNKRDALIREKKLKHANKDYLKWLIDQPTNLLNSK